MIRTRELLVASVAGAVGLLAGLAWPDRDPPTEAPQPVAPPEAPRAERSARQELAPPAPPEPAKPDPELEACQLEARLLRGQLRVYEGAWREWPEEVPEAFDRQPLEVALSAAWKELAVIDALDCSEYPCLVTVTLPEDQHECCKHLMEALPEELERQGARNYRTYAHSFEGGPMRAVITLASEAHWSEDLSRRTKWRVEVAGELIDEEPLD